MPEPNKDETKLFRAKIKGEEIELPKMELQQLMRELMAEDVKAEGARIQKEIQDKIMVGRSPLGGVPQEEEKLSCGEYFKQIRDIEKGIPFKSKAITIGEDPKAGYLAPPATRAELMRLSMEMEAIYPRTTKVSFGASDTLEVPYMNQATYSPASGFFGGIKFAWMAEGATFAATDFSAKMCKLYAHKLGGMSKVSDEWFADVPGGQPLIVQVFTAAHAAFRDDAFINGTGVGQPLGLTKTLASISVSRAAAGKVVETDFATMLDKLWPINENNVFWLCNRQLKSSIIQLEDSAGNRVWSQDAKLGPNGGIYGYPVVFTTLVPVKGTAYDVQLIDGSAILAADKNQLTAKVSEHFYFDSGYMALRFESRFDGKPWLETYITDKNSLTYSPFIHLT